MPRCCSFCQIVGHNIRTCNSNELSLLTQQMVEKDQYSIEHYELPVYEHSTYVQWLFTLTDRQLKGLNSFHLDRGDNANRYVKIARLVLYHSRLFPYDRVLSIYNHPTINIRNAHQTQKLMIENIWMRIQDSGMRYALSRDISLRDGYNCFNRLMDRIHTIFQSNQRYHSSGYIDDIFQELVRAISMDLNDASLVMPEHLQPRINLYLDRIHRYLGYGMTIESVERFCPHIWHLMMNTTLRPLFELFEDGEIEEAGQFQDVIQTQKLNIVFDIVAPKGPSDTAVAAADECCLCYENLTDTSFNCKHEYCSDCVYKLFDSMKNNHTIKPNCPFCRTDITHVCLPNSEILHKMNSAFL